MSHQVPAELKARIVNLTPKCGCGSVKFTWGQKNLAFRSETPDPFVDYKPVMIGRCDGCGKLSMFDFEDRVLQGTQKT